MENFLFKQVKENARSPLLQYEKDNGFDLFSCENGEISPWQTVKIGVGVSIEMATGYFGLVLPRSSVSVNGVLIHPGVIDEGYTGEIQVIATNLFMEKYFYNQNKGIAQIVFLKSLPLELAKNIEIINLNSDSCATLNSMDYPSQKREKKGLGSTDVR